MTWQKGVMMALVLLGLGSCARRVGEEKRPEIVVGSAAGETVQTFQAKVSGKIVTTTPGLGATVQPLPKLTIATRFEGQHWRSRVDIPGEQFADGRPRIALYDTAQQVVRVVFADTFELDGETDMQALAKLLEGVLGGVQSVGAAGAFEQQSADEIRASWGQAAQVHSQSVGPEERLTRHIPLEGGEMTQTLVHDDRQDVITRIETQSRTLGLWQESQSQFSYQEVAALPHHRVPTRILTETKTTLTAAGQTVETSSDIQYQEVRLNTLSDSYFQLGGLP